MTGRAARSLAEGGCLNDVRNHQPGTGDEPPIARVGSTAGSAPSEEGGGGRRGGVMVVEGGGERVGGWGEVGEGEGRG